MAASLGQRKGPIRVVCSRHVLLQHVIPRSIYLLPAALWGLSADVGTRMLADHICTGESGLGTPPTINCMGGVLLQGMLNADDVGGGSQSPAAAGLGEDDGAVYVYE